MFKGFKSQWGAKGSPPKQLVLVVALVLVGFPGSSLVAKDGASIQYEMTDSLNLEGGVIEFWLSPNYSSSDFFSDGFRGVGRFFALVGDAGKPANGGTILDLSHHVIGSSSRLSVNLNPRPRNWKPWIMACPDLEKGKWYRLTFAWQGSQCRVYLNGEVISERDLGVTLADYFANNAQLRFFLAASPGSKSPPAAFADLLIAAGAELSLGKSQDGLEKTDPRLILLDTFEEVGGGTTRPTIYKGYESQGGRIEGEYSHTVGERGPAILFGVQ